MKHESTFSSDEFESKAGKAASFLKGLASPHRLAILCELAAGEKHVSALIEATGLPQTSMSQHLLKLRQEGIIDYRRNHRTLTYYICDEAALKIMAVLYENFCKKDHADKGETL